ncbi:MAG TPA: ATPase, T2SS/T4P/T4SS family [Candidatus Saccharimonadales bacterium]
MDQNNDANQELRSSEERATADRAGRLGLKYQDSRGWTETVGLIKDFLTVPEMYNFHAVPTAVDSGQLVFAVTINTPQTVLKQLRSRFSDFNISFLLVAESGYKELMRRHDPPQTIRYEDIAITSPGQSQTLEDVSKTLETVRPDDVLDYLIKQADRLSASDIHLENEKDYVGLRFRVDGTLHPVARLSKDKFRQLSSSIAIRSNVSVNAPEPQTGHMSSQIETGDGTKALNMRIETVPTANGQDAVIRLFNLDRHLMQLDNLGLSERHRQQLEDIVEHPHGLVMVVGPTGSGKTTTLYSIIDRLNQSTRKIVTLEDPVEYAFEGITQIPIKGDKDRQAFADKLRAVLRLDPDVIMIGEIRDIDTAKTAMQAALTGHLVLSTFHAADAATALTRLLEVIGQNPLFINAIRLIVAQRLARRLDDNTKQAYRPDDAIKNQLRPIIESLPEGYDRPNLDEIELFRPVETADTPFGYSGRIMIAEQLALTPAVLAALNRDPSRVETAEIRRVAVAEGMLTMPQDGILKAISGVTSVEEIFRQVDV